MVSITLMNCSSESALPHSSTAVYMRRYMATGKVHPPLTTSSSQVKVTLPQMSSDEAYAESGL